MKLDWYFIGFAMVAIIFAGVGYMAIIFAGKEVVGSHVCQSYFTGYAIQQCKERVRLGEPAFNEVRE